MYYILYFQPEDITMPNPEEIMIFQKNLGKSSSMMFNNATGLPTRSSPVSIHSNEVGKQCYRITHQI